MNGPEHYIKAEEILDNLRRARADINSRINPEKAATVLAEAQVHATLALAAATALNDAEAGMALADNRAWDSAAGVNQSARSTT